MDEVSNGYLGSAQWSWLNQVWMLGQGVEPPQVQKVWWNKKKDEESQRSKWEDYRHVVLPYDHRLVMVNEIVFDIDLKPPLNNFKDIRDANRKLDAGMIKHNIPHYLTQTGGSGFHQHVFYRGGFNRVYMGKKILKLCGLLGYYGEGRPIDPRPVDSRRHMIRMIGGRKMLSPSTWNHKTWIPVIPDRIKHVKSKKDVKFPEVVEVWDYR